jgi:glycosyltransferase involved in cell wall biosynthesis
VVVPPGDAQAVASALQRLRAGEPRQLAAAARKAAEPFTYRRQVADFERIYRRLPRAGPSLP